MDRNSPGSEEAKLCKKTHAITQEASRAGLADFSEYTEFSQVEL